MENTAERNAYFIQLKSNGHTDNNDGGFEAIVIGIVLILNKELLRIWCKSFIVFQTLPGLRGMRTSSFKGKLQNNCKEKVFAWCMVYDV